MNIRKTIASMLWPVFERTIAEQKRAISSLEDDCLAFYRDAAARGVNVRDIIGSGIRSWMITGSTISADKITVLAIPSPHIKPSCNSDSEIACQNDNEIISKSLPICKLDAGPITGELTKEQLEKIIRDETRITGRLSQEQVDELLKRRDSHSPDISASDIKSDRITGETIDRGSSIEEIIRERNLADAYFSSPTVQRYDAIIKGGKTIIISGGGLLDKCRVRFVPRDALELTVTDEEPFYHYTSVYRPYYDINVGGPQEWRHVETTCKSGF